LCGAFYILFQRQLSIIADDKSGIKLRYNIELMNKRVMRNKYLKILEYIKQINLSRLI